jgi:hypothetical protein
MRFLRAGEPWLSGSGHIRDNEGTFFEPDASVLALAERMGKVNAVDSAIAARDLGRARGILLGREFSKRDGVPERDGVSQEWWLQCVKRAKNAQERRKVELVVNEWADAASIASHIGYDIDLFCTKDCGHRAGGTSILNAVNKAWLEQTYGVKFVTLTDLAAMI